MNNSILFLILAFISCGAAVGMLITRNLLHAALLMFVVMFGLAGLFVLAQADVLAVSHLMVYVGGVMVLLIIGIMLTRQRGKGLFNDLKVSENAKWFPLLITLVVFYGWFTLIECSKLPTVIVGGDESKIKQVGYLFVTQYSFVFELVGVFLLIALVGATYIAKKDE